VHGVVTLKIRKTEVMLKCLISSLPTIRHAEHIAEASSDNLFKILCDLVFCVVWIVTRRSDWQLNIDIANNKQTVTLLTTFASDKLKQKSWK